MHSFTYIIDCEFTCAIFHVGSTSPKMQITSVTILNYGSEYYLTSVMLKLENFLRYTAASSRRGRTSSSSFCASVACFDKTFSSDETVPFILSVSAWSCLILTNISSVAAALPAKTDSSLLSCSCIFSTSMLVLISFYTPTSNLCLLLLHFLWYVSRSS